ncbi:class I tRNA ligase family protein [Candidatus Nomurabacteria bacterium]|nr:class I tRNA ligase family protein [Candidatus Nomurabacteria bacterium]
MSKNNPTNESQEIKKSPIAQQEESILNFWNEHNIFQRSVDKPAPKGEFVFYDGPPFATGLPHYGHLVGGTLKDAIPRYKTMQGYRVSRKWGWDCHGLPIENLIEKELGLANKMDIEQHGIDNFNEAARASVFRYEKEWKKTVPRLGRWVDMDNPYKSMDSSYTESVWWSFKQLFEKGLVYEGFKSMHLCPRCETTLANFEVNQGYADITDLSVTAKFKLEDGRFALAWTTTPWTLPGNVALAVGADIEYVEVTFENETYMVAKELVEKVFEGKEYTFGSSMKGSDLVGISYKPVFDYYSKDTTLENHQNSWKIYTADFVTTEDGTGIVHIAPAFGEDDLNLGKEYDLPFIQHVSKGGRFVGGVTDFAGHLVKAKDDHQSADIEIIKYLAHHGTLFSKKKYTHSYPHCWRCDTPLLNYATSSWFLDVSQIKDQMLEKNTHVHWVPGHIKDGRFGKWLEGARDWALSRSRYWGAVLPVWKNTKTDEPVVMGSFDDLQKYIKPRKNKYCFIRHGESESNANGYMNSDIAKENHLTEKGQQQARDAVVHVEAHHPDIIIYSPLMRTHETAKIIRDGLNFHGEFFADDRLRELDFGEFEGRSFEDFLQIRRKELFFHKPFPGGESHWDVVVRVGRLIDELEEKYEGTTILLVGHGAIGEALSVLDRQYSPTEAWNRMEEMSTSNAECKTFGLTPFPHTADYQFDVHRPYIDNLELVDTDGTPLELIGEVFDVWYESGSMPYASIHYPFENKDLFENVRFPADFIAEGLDQTRGWFYVLSVLGVALFGKIPFKNSIVNGMILAEDGKKMSKRLRNYPDVDAVLNTHGADALRLYLLASPAVHADSLNFVEKDMADMSRKVMGRLRNILSLYQTYASGKWKAESDKKSDNVLDVWILHRLNQIIIEMTEAIEHYEYDRHVRPLFDFVDDFSTWYIRRSRDRFKSDNQEEREAVERTTHQVLKTLALLMAPTTPFIAEEFWQELRTDTDPLSVHLGEYPATSTATDDVALAMMQRVRDLVSAALELRAQAGIKVRQPLGKLKVKSEKWKEEYSSIIQDEVNVKEIVEDSSLDGELELDTEITPELAREGDARELIRTIQQYRKDTGLEPDDELTLKVVADAYGKALWEDFYADIKSTANVVKYSFIESLDDAVEVKMAEGELRFGE